jgi:hypothetical protein
MNIKAKISFKYSKEEEAKLSLKSLKPDNLGFINSYQVNNCYICNLNSDSLRTILATIDDLLFGEMIVEKVMALKE